MATLKNVQTTFADLMLDHPDALNAPPQILIEALAAGDIPLNTRLAVYRNNIIGSLTDVIIASFPMLEKLVGINFLTGMARTFILKNPPTQGCLNTYGAGFDDFIRTFPPAQSLAYLPDVAAFEIAQNRAYYAPDDTALTAKHLAAIAPEYLADTVLILRSSAYLIESQYPLTALQDYCLHGADDHFDMTQGGVTLMVYRPALQTRIIELDAPSFAFLRGASQGQSLGDTAAAVMSAYPDFDIQAFLAAHIGLGSFSV